MSIIIESPHRFKERFLFYGGGGAGKSTAVLSMARYMPYADFHIGDTDVSYAYDRLLATEFTDVDERGNAKVEVIIPEWEPFIEWLAHAVERGDPTKDVLVVDNGTMPWSWVQNWYGEQVFGKNIADVMLEIKKSAKDNKEYAKAMSESMNWPLINKQFQAGFYSQLHKWRGHFVIVAEAGEVGRDDSDATKAMFGTLGLKPKGQNSMHHVAATNLLFMQRGKTQWAISSAKDRGRLKVERQVFDEFAVDYLVDHAGWVQRRVKGEAA